MNIPAAVEVKRKRGRPSLNRADSKHGEISKFEKPEAK